MSSVSVCVCVCLYAFASACFYKPSGPWFRAVRSQQKRPLTGASEMSGCDCVSGKAESFQQGASAGRLCIAVKRHGHPHDFGAAHGMVMVVVVEMMAMAMAMSTAGLHVTILTVRCFPARAYRTVP
jgi:hypothetical protein